MEVHVVLKHSTYYICRWRLLQSISNKTLIIKWCCHINLIIPCLREVEGTHYTPPGLGKISWGLAWLFVIAWKIDCNPKFKEGLLWLVFIWNHAYDNKKFEKLSTYISFTRMRITTMKLLHNEWSIQWQ